MCLIFHLEAKTPNAGPQAFPENTLPIKASPQLCHSLFMLMNYMTFPFSLLKNNYQFYLFELVAAIANPV